MYKNIFKPILDRLLAFVIFIILLPIFFLICILLLVTQRKSPFFLQKRHGLNAKKFVIIKFRTLINDHKIFKQTTEHSEDVTRIGKFLRSTHLDEIPQLLNIIKGDMSFIGPRPHFPDHDIDIAKKVPEFLTRYKVKPGFTGLAQVSNNRGAIKDDIHARERLFYDIKYIEDITFFLDLKIFFKSAQILFLSLIKS